MSGAWEPHKILPEVPNIAADLRKRGFNDYAKVVEILAEQAALPHKNFCTNLALWGKDILKWLRGPS